MKNLFWCSDCRELFERGTQHNKHAVTNLGGNEPDEYDSILALDEIIQLGLSILENRETEVANARQVQDVIEETRAKITDAARIRIERVCMDLREAMEERYWYMLREVNKKVGDMELRTQAVIKTARPRFDATRTLIEQAAMTLPDEDGAIDPIEKAILLCTYKIVKDIELTPRPLIKHVDFNVIHCNSYQRKKDCQQMAARLSGELLNADEGCSFETLQPGEEILPLEKPELVFSRDLLKN